MFRRNAFGQFNVDDFLTEAGTPSRRRFLTGLAASGLLLTGGGVIDQRAWANPVFAAYPFGLGIASGDPSADGFVIWTKLAPLPLARNGGMPMKAVEVAYEIATEANMRGNVQRGTALARPELGHAVHVEIAGLEPNRDYFYRFSCGGERSMIGRARTLPAAGAGLERVNFGVLGCQRYEDGFFTAFRHVADERFDFVFHYGDYIYEYRMIRPNERPLPVARVMPGEPDEIYSLADYRPALRHLQDGSRPPARPCLGALDRLLRRPRGRQQFRRHGLGGEHSAGDLRAAPCGRLPGLV